MAFLQYIFLKALRSLDRDYIVLISVPSHQSFIQDALREKKRERKHILSFLSFSHYAVGGAWGLMIEAC